jgi:hypothetical protein
MAWHGSNWAEEWDEEDSSSEETKFFKGALREKGSENIEHHSYLFNLKHIEANSDSTKCSSQ